MLQLPYMNTKQKIISIISIIIVVLFVFIGTAQKPTIQDQTPPVRVDPIGHASMILTFGDTDIYVDPVGDEADFVNKPEADIILITDIHGDHLQEAVLVQVLRDTTTLIAPQAVKDQLSETLANRVLVLNNGETATDRGLNIFAMPMYNLPESDDARHIKGRGNGYIVTSGNYDVYIAGDTAGIPEMRSLTGIDVAFVPMNLPYTMDVDEAASAVLDFAPTKVYPYHYRTPEGLSNIERFKTLVTEANPDIEVVFANWYN